MENTHLVDPHKVSEEVKTVEKEVVTKLTTKRDSVVARFPLLFTMLATFGLVATFYGFEHIIDNIPLLANNPFILLTIGIGSLLLTGTLYKKLG